MKITLIKFHKKEQHLNLTRIHTFVAQLTDPEQMGDTELQQINDLMLISLNEDSHFSLIGSTTKGSVFTFDVSSLINLHFVV